MKGEGDTGPLCNTCLLSSTLPAAGFLGCLHWKCTPRLQLPAWFLQVRCATYIHTYIRTCEAFTVCYVCDVCGVIVSCKHSELPSLVGRIGSVNLKRHVLVC